MIKKRRLYSAINGVFIWKRLLSRYDNDLDNFFLIHTENDEEIKAFFDYLNEYYIEFKVRRCVIISYSESCRVLFQHKYNGNRNFEFVFITKENAEAIIDAYYYNAQGDKLMIVSLDKVWGRRLDNLLAREDITREDLVVGGLLNIELARKSQQKVIDDWTFRKRG